MANVNEELLIALQLMLDNVDYTSGACGLGEPIAGVLPKEILERAKKAVKDAREASK